MRLSRLAALFTCGAVVLQLGGCSSADAFDFVQTLLLGVTAAGSVYIIRNA